MKFIALLLIIFLSPLGLILALIIFLEIRSSVFFKQKRIGKDKIPFVIYKFKTMENGQVLKTGKILRKLGLDEIPQLVNILIGDMNFIGPRPLTNQDIERLGWDETLYQDRWSVKPGISCLAQLSNICDASHSMKEDLYYVHNKSLQLDLKIILKTILIPIIGKRTT